MTHSFLNNQLRVFIDLEIIQSNYKNLCTFTKTPMASVLKANAYGLGAVPVGLALYAAGCRQFFLATLGEALEIRDALPKDATIYLLHGCFEEEVETLLTHHIIPVLNNSEQLASWQKAAQQQGKKLPALIHFDTGMNRLGLDAQHVSLVKEAAQKDIEILYVMSHLACADDLNNPYSALQRQRFLEIAAHFPGVPRSLASSEGIGLGPDYRFDLLRVGISFYGIIAYSPHTRFAVRPQAKIIHTRTIKAGTTIGYSQRYTASGPKRIGTIAMGFSDGLGCCATNRGHVYIGTYEAPIIGRVSMDLTVIDLTHIPEEVAKPGVWVDLFRDNLSHLRLAGESSMVLYEITCRIGRRFQKIYQKICEHDPA
jgi:alanine racemase